MVLIFEKDNCTQCYATKLAFDRQGTKYESRQIEEDHSWKTYLPEALMAPVVVDTETGEAWSGFRRENIIEYALSA